MSDSLETLYKRESESLFLSVDFTRWLDSGETLSSVVSMVIDSNSGVTIGTPVIVGNKAQARFSGGESILEAYCVKTKVTTIGGPDTQTYLAKTDLIILPDCE